MTLHAVHRDGCWGRNWHVPPARQLGCGGEAGQRHRLLRLLLAGPFLALPLKCAVVRCAHRACDEVSRCRGDPP